MATRKAKTGKVSAGAGECGGDVKAQAAGKVKEDVTDNWRRLLIDHIVFGLLSYDIQGRREGTSIHGAMKRWRRLCEEGLRFGRGPDEIWPTRFWLGTQTDVVLDLGCGDAFLGTRLTQAGHVEYIGIDSSAECLKSVQLTKHNDGDGSQPGGR
ncbi:MULTISPECIES: class I SAM-dependent methyltransferase [unclassified Variovorax]|uniref:class I SAM-dependent methyltransferase n=1 Tax=unclassified Variovorax TaxID=663243 RepID=UPI0008394A5F|nr:MULTISPECIES: class I SAM-dependent methyltransferase [unclassified Variovorax]PNG50224.1 hypothetical protein CHC06_05847 [Variovorax sp. B2]PNG51097.1 hypothetical protein CHC07_05753 [Variovorax sp. B4]VTU42406.1 hypothetical protein SRS16P1_00262 [Variovorax sp. SRS16]VTU42434.1 hypothetical protein E5P1_00260 [Variovorax sp. PBL-E5]VTU44089.1 hypothetical protein H6P1_00669 [Variovorax sp. PBL-H6]